MKSVKELPLLATAAAMVIVAISSNTDWIRITGVVVAIAAVGIFARANLKKSDQ